MSGDPRELLEQQIRETEERFRTMADAAPVLLWMSRTDGMCTFFNQTWLDFTGRSLEQEWGVGWAEGVHFEDFQRCIDTYVDAFNKRQVFEMEYRLRRHDGVYRWILDRGTPRYMPDGTFAGYIGSCADITERKQLEADLRKAVKVRDDFLSMASHELRTPLTALKLRAERLQSLSARAVAAQSGDPNAAPNPTVEKLARDAEVALTQVGHLVKMVDVLLDVSRISEGPLKLDRDDLEVGPLVASVADRLKEPASTAGSPIRVDIRETATARWDRFASSRWSRIYCPTPSSTARANRSTWSSTARTAAPGSWSPTAAPGSRRSITPACSNASRASRPPATTAASAWGSGSPA